MKKQETKNSYAVFGLGEFGRSVAEELMAAGADVMAVDKDEDLISDIAPHVTMAVQVDATELHAFDSLGISNMDGVIVTMTSCLEASIMTIMAAKEAGVPFILAKSRNDEFDLRAHWGGQDRDTGTGRRHPCCKEHCKRQLYRFLRAVQAGAHD